MEKNEQASHAENNPRAQMAHAGDCKRSATNNLEPHTFLNRWLDRISGGNLFSSVFDYSGELLRKPKRDYSLAIQSAQGKIKTMKNKTLTNYKRCAYSQCGKVISNGRGSRRVYCNQACKQAAYRERLEAEAGKVTLISKSNKGSR